MHSPKSLTKVLSGLMDSIANFSYEEPHVYTFRGSSLPYCSVREALTLCRKQTNTLPIRKTSIKQQLDMDIGTLIHAHFQKILGALGSIYGSWTCAKCKKEFEMQTGPVICCGNLADYKEIRVKDDSSGFSGSVDGLIMNSDGSFIVIDFKTKARLPMGAKANELDRSHRAQILAYKYLLTQPPYNFLISSIAIIYVLRSDITKFRIQEVPDDEFTELEFKHYVKNRDKMRTALKCGDMASLTKICTAASDAKYCPYGSICFSSNSSRDIQNEWERSFGLRAP